MAYHFNNLYYNQNGIIPFQRVNNDNVNYREERNETIFHLQNGIIVRETRITIYENGYRYLLHDRCIGHRIYREVTTFYDNNQQNIQKYTINIHPIDADINHFVGEFIQLMDEWNNNNWNQEN